MYGISLFRDEADAQEAAAAGRKAAPDAPRIVVDKGGASRWWTVCIDEYVGRAAQVAIRAISVHAARLEVVEPERAHCGDVHGKWVDPRVYLEELDGRNAHRSW